MDTVVIAIFCVFAAMGLALVLWMAFGALLMPFKGRYAEEISLVVHITGEDPSIADTVRALVWLRQLFFCRSEIILQDEGASGETVQSARRLASMYSGVRIINAKDVEMANVWMNRTDN